MLVDGGIAPKTGQRVLGRRTVELFASNRLPACSLNGEVDCGELGRDSDRPAPGNSGTNQGYECFSLRISFFGSLRFLALSAR